MGRHTLQHAEQQDEHLLLQSQQLPQELHVARVLVQLALQLCKDVQEARDCIPEPTVSKGLLVPHTGTLGRVQVCECVHQPNLLPNLE